MTRKKRVGLSKKLRFEVFKRDGFVCQYCGAHPPEAVLHADHIDPVAEGGESIIENLITACQGCNLGKGAERLSSAPEPLLDRAEEMREREDQLVGYQELMREKRERLETEMWQVADVLDPGSPESGFNRANLITIKRFLEKIGFDAVLDSAEIAYAKRLYSDRQTFRYFCGVCWKKIRGPQGES